MPDRDLIELIRLVGAPSLPEQPWLGWLLVALCRQRARQTWLVKIRDEHLADVDEDQGDVPGLPGWTYDFHGSGLCLTGPGGQAIDMDFDGHEPAGSTIDPYFFAAGVRASPPTSFPEAQVRRFLPSSDLVARALKELRRIGAVHHPVSEHVFRLSARLEFHHEGIAAVDFHSKGVRRRWREALGDADDATSMAALRRWLVEMIRTQREHATLLRDVHGLLAPDQVHALATEVAAGPIDTPTARSMNALHAVGIAPDSVAIGLLDRLDPSQHHPYPAHAVTSYLLAHGIERPRCLATIEAFAAVDVVKGYKGNPYRDHLALLMLLRAPERAWPLLRLALQDPTPGVHKPIGAVMVLLDDDRAPRLLLEAALAAEATQRRFLLGCLAHRPDEASRALAAAHMPPPPERSSSVGYTHEEVEYANLRHEVERHLVRARQALTDHRTS